ncbi:MAG TPA: response regulator transcription factor [Terracidiphilus sp.]|nr:response regulator transcription factor [Terracidiphilus sp.]
MIAENPSAAVNALRASTRLESSERRFGVLVVDDHPLMRLGIAAMIEAQPDMCAVAQAGTGEVAIQLYFSTQPDIVLVDLRLPGIGGVEVIREIRRRDPKAKFVVLTTYDGDEDIHQALEAGARGYIIKGMPAATMLDALRRVQSGVRYLPPPVEKILEARVPDSKLSPREREVLALIVAGRSNKEIAAELGISRATVKFHVSIIFSRMGVEDRTQAAVAALQRGLVRL